jgi:hypothetical protein
MGGVDSLPQEEFNRIQQLFLWKTQAKGLEKGKKHESRSNEGVKTMKTTPRIST